ncbi:hypothetical protein GCM10007063_15700 [Lentibacillus kapialis]|uniref:Sce7725 family protein n=1 Tax=Lentibacillus kapialis TaxID=340214 RepID=A0A917UXS1_9BACI|nr:sce7725 family protein [Lentibacillus kapialis]GGJ94023.1 hypothetical protein GCM10007063_15700 [Lentibacillus kapialis]
MYFPYLRGRQFELIAVRELAEKGLINDNVIPIIEPIKPTSTLLKTLKTFNNCNKAIGVIGNPQVGNFKDELDNLNNNSYKQEYMEQLNKEHVIRGHILNADSRTEINELSLNGVKPEELLLVHNRSEFIASYQEFFHDNPPTYNLIPYDITFKRKIRTNKVLFADRFPKKARNVDYLNEKDRSFSEDHLFYMEEGFQGFSDFTIVGSEFSESGFAPMAVAIHIVYLDGEDSLRIHHFVSNSNDDIRDPARKFYEALDKLMAWNESQQLDTNAINELRKHYANETYPGLGSLKKLAIMHHIELINGFLNRSRV